MRNLVSLECLLINKDVYMSVVAVGSPELHSFRLNEGETMSLWKIPVGRSRVVKDFESFRDGNAYYHKLCRKVRSLEEYGIDARMVRTEDAFASVIELKLQAKPSEHLFHLEQEQKIYRKLGDTSLEDNDIWFSEWPIELTDAASRRRIAMIGGRAQQVWDKNPPCGLDFQY
jgi:hypothetical protein